VFSLVYSAGNVALPAFAAERRAVVLVLLGLIARLSINISCPQRSAANPSHAAAAIECGMDRRTPIRYIDPGLLRIFCE